MNYKRLENGVFVDVAENNLIDGDRIKKEIVAGVWVELNYSAPSQPKPKVTFSNAQVTSNTQNGITDYFGINTLKQGADWELTADVSDPNGLLTGLTSMNIIIEKVVNQTTVVSDERFNAVFANNAVTITAPEGFESTGNYMFTAKRQNEGLAYLGLAFEIEFDTVEFDIQRN